MVGSTTDAVAAGAGFPVTLVRPAPPPGPILLAVDAGHDQADTGALFAFAFEEAALRGLPLRALYAAPGPTLRSYPLSTSHHGSRPQVRRAARQLTEALLPWRDKYPGVRVEEVCHDDVPAQAVIAAARHASLAILGRHAPHAARPRLGVVAHAAAHHAACPIVLVPVPDAVTSRPRLAP
ncbi:universal stress protein [Streptomyces sp. Q6]|uniref:Universal stress protein n=1 Tax=Streptomyces citrinus TaxID=3118173 RepID=A0ACD5AN17_9ACTN